MTTLPTREDVWPNMPRCASGPEWGKVIEDALEGLRDRMEYDRDRVFRDPSDFEHEWADAWVPVYSKDRADLFHALDLWACDEVESEVEEYGGFTEREPFTFTEAFGLALYAAARLTMRAVLAAMEGTDNGEEE